MSTATPEKIVLTKLINGETYYSQLSFNLLKVMMDDLQKENQEMREALKWALSTLPHASIDKDDYDKVISLQNKFNLSETPNSSKEGVNCSYCSGNHLNFDCPTMANE